MALVVVGNIDHDEIVKLAAKYKRNYVALGSSVILKDDNIANIFGAATAQCKVIFHDSELVHMTAGCISPGRHHRNRWALSVISTMLGGGLSSRLFQQIREKRGIAYTIYSSVDTFTELGALSFYVGLHKQRLAECSEVITAILADIVDHGFTEREVSRAKSSLRGAVILGLEDPVSRMLRFGRQMIHYPTVRIIEQSLHALSKVTVAEVNNLAAQLFSKSLTVTLIGPVKKQAIPRSLTQGFHS